MSMSKYAVFDIIKLSLIIIISIALFIYLAVIGNYTYITVQLNG